MNKFAYRLGAVLLAALPGVPVVALEPMTAAALVEACRAYVQEPGSGAVCKAYVQGYVAGAERAVFGAVERPSDFFRRALRTRAGGYVDNSRAEVLYCLPEDQGMAPLAGRIIALGGGFQPAHSAGALIRAVLDEHYRCEQ